MATKAHIALAEGPEPGERAEEGRFATPGWAAHRHRLTRPHMKARLVEEQISIRQPKVEPADLKPFGPCRRVDPDRVGRLDLLGALHRLAEGRQALNHRHPFGQHPRIGVDKPGESPLHVTECAGGLCQISKRDDSGKIARRGDDERENARYLGIEVCEPIQPLAVYHEQPPVGVYPAEGGGKSLCLVGLSMI